MSEGQTSGEQHRNHARSPSSVLIDGVASQRKVLRGEVAKALVTKDLCNHGF